MPLLILFLILLPQPIALEHFPFFVVWNVGQGSSATYVSEKLCLHVDLGGEDFPQKLHEHCWQKSNRVFLTHFDKDHINFIKKTKKKWPKLCLGTKVPKTLTPWKRKLLSGIPQCPTPSSQLKTLGHPNFSKRNESFAYIFNDSILITGDASSAQEKRLLQEIPSKPKIHVLLAGHHGSRTSTSNTLLKKLPQLQLAIVSARKKKYGHPHKEVIARLKKATIPLITTENYGHIFLHLQ